KLLNWTRGTYHHARGTLIPYQPQMIYLAAHEVGHDVWSDKFVHASPVTSNDVPRNPTSDFDDVPYGYALMAGSPYRGTDGYIVTSARERELRGWLQTQSSTAGRSSSRTASRSGSARARPSTPTA